ncbi:MAG: PEP-CTERM sorting domain-containing protein [Bryobacteraceae bacterium]
MNIKKTLIVGLLATIGSGWLQAESLNITFAANGTISAVNTGTGTSASCTNCVFDASLGAVTATPEFSFGGDTYYELSIGAGGSFTASTTGTLYFPSSGTSGPALVNSGINGGNLVSGSFDAYTPPGGTSPTGGPTGPVPPRSVTFNNVSIPVSVNLLSSPNFLSILAAFNLPVFEGTGTLDFSTITVHNPGVSQTLSLGGGTLSLDVSAIPEPSSVLLIGLGLVCVAFIGRKRMLAHRL